jgi:hypothetical protein
MMFNLHVNLTAAGSADLITTLERLMDELHAAEGQDGRLSCSVDFTVAADRNRADVGVDLDVGAPTDVDAFAVGMTWLRSAAHAAGAGTPTWETATPTSGHVTLSLTEPVTLGQADLVGA